MRVRTWRPRAAATAVLCVLIGSAVALHERNDENSFADPHAAHVMPSAVPVAVTTAAPLPRTGWVVTADDAQASAATVLDVARSLSQDAGGLDQKVDHFLDSIRTA